MMSFELFMCFILQACMGLLLTALILFVTFSGLYILACLTIQVYNRVPDYVARLSRLRFEPGLNGRRRWTSR